MSKSLSDSFSGYVSPVKDFFDRYFGELFSFLKDSLVQLEGPYPGATISIISLIAIAISLLLVRQARGVSVEGRREQFAKRLTYLTKDLFAEIDLLKDEIHNLEADLAGLAKQRMQYRQSLGAEKEVQAAEILKPEAKDLKDQDKKQPKKDLESKPLEDVSAKSKEGKKEPKPAETKAEKPKDEKPKAEELRAKETPPAPALESKELQLSDAEKLKSGLESSRSGFISRFRFLFTGRTSVDDSLFSELEELLISTDLGAELASSTVQKLKEYVKSKGNVSGAEYLEFIKEQINLALKSDVSAKIESSKVDGQTRVIVLVGVNGVGKTTTVAKLASKFNSEGSKVLLAPCDTFRAAAMEQLQHWASHIGVQIVSGKTSEKPTTVAFRAIEEVKKGDFDVLIIDTAGRLHTKNNLMAELQKVLEIIAREQPGAPHEVILVVDGSTGQNALQQAKEFSEISKLSGIVVTKLDGTSKGGIIVSIKSTYNIPIRYIGIGERVDDLLEFDPKDFAEALISRQTPQVQGANTKEKLEPLTKPQTEDKPAPKKVKRKRRDL